MKLIYKSSYDLYCIFRKIIYNYLYESFNSMFALSQRISKIQKLFKRNKFLQFSMLWRVSKDTQSWSLEREKNSFLQKTKQGNRWRKQSKLEGWKKIGQRWLCFNNVQKASLLRYRWLCQRTQISNRTNYRKVFAA
jgi:hypothetical protein